MKYIIRCSNCGMKKEMDNRRSPSIAVEEGWGSFGAALYCPACCTTWSERNGKSMSSAVNTLFRIVDVSREQAGVE